MKLVIFIMCTIFQGKFRFLIVLYVVIISCAKGWFVVFYAIFNNISAILWRSVLLVEETGGPGENHLPIASH
jgi:hypothetical protein